MLAQLALVEHHQPGRFVDPAQAKQVHRLAVPARHIPAVAEAELQRCLADIGDQLATLLSLLHEMGADRQRGVGGADQRGLGYEAAAKAQDEPQQGRGSKQPLGRRHDGTPSARGGWKGQYSWQQGREAATAVATLSQIA
ncbi:hypothetical protein D3C78_1499240 [compost metagenome]